MHVGKEILVSVQDEWWVKSIDEERDLGMLISKDFKFSKQCIMVKNKANLMLGIINRGYHINLLK